MFSSYSFWTLSSLDVPAGVTQEGHTGFLIHLPSAYSIVKGTILLSCQRHRNLIRPCHPSHSMPPALILPQCIKGSMILITKTSRRDRGDTLALCFLVTLEIIWVGSYWANPLFSTFFPLSTQVSPVSHSASTTILRFFALIRLSSALTDPILVPVPVHISATVLASVPVPLPVPVPVPVPIRCPPRFLFFSVKTTTTHPNVLTFLPL